MTTAAPVPFDFQLPTAQLLNLASTVDDDQLVDPTPCEGRTISQLLGHVSGLLGAFRAVADKDLGPWTDRNPDEDASAHALLEFVSGFDAAGTPGLFGPAVEIAEDAPPFDRVLARSGREPWWQPRSSD